MSKNIVWTVFQFNPFALRKAKIVYNFGLFECKRVKFACQLLLSRTICISKLIFWDQKIYFEISVVWNELQLLRYQELVVSLLNIHGIFQKSCHCISLLNNPKNLDPSYKTDLDIWDYLERAKLVL